MHGCGNPKFCNKAVGEYENVSSKHHSPQLHVPVSWAPEHAVGSSYPRSNAHQYQAVCLQPNRARYAFACLNHTGRKTPTFLCCRDMAFRAVQGKPASKESRLNPLTKPKRGCSADQHHCWSVTSMDFFLPSLPLRRWQSGTTIVLGQ